MENNDLKIFTNKAISIATFFGGPLAAGLLISKNFKVFGNENAARNSIFIGIISTILLLTGVFLIPENIAVKSLQALIPTIYTALVYFLVEKLQGQKIRDFLANNGRTAPNRQAVGYGLLGFLTIATFIIIYVVIAIPKEELCSIPQVLRITQIYDDKKININKNVRLHYSREIDKSKSQKIAEIIKQSGFMEGSEGADLFLDEELMKFRLKFIVPDISNLSDPSIIYEFNELKKYINDNLNFDKPIEILFTDICLVDEFELPENDNSNLQVYEPQIELHTYKINDFHTIYYNVIMPIEDVRIVGEAVKRLKGYFPVNQRIDIIFLNNDDNYLIKFFVLKNFWQEPSIIYMLKSTVDYIKNSGIEKQINLVLIDSQTNEETQIMN
jgi:hypothetical protein